ncbi:MAG: 3-isopropylmalate/(R)-2-methylmalate dehydratase large subunit [Gammaproteobacteria bacterium]|jgi:3-isopropylmalate/(R)-2-methylmalate dehydratase large subunit
MDEMIRFEGRILYLSDNPQTVRAQINGTDVSLNDARPLRDNISTDEITPTTSMLVYDDRLGDVPYVGYQAGGEHPIGEKVVRAGGFAVTVGGKRYGKGSSREHSPVAEMSAGIRLIVAESFERIYQQNCANIGVFTTTDFTVLDRILAGEAIPIEEFLVGRDELTQQVIRAGGLLPYSRTVEWPAPVARAAQTSQRPLTLVEKIIDRHLHPDVQSVKVGDGVFIATDFRFSHDYFTGMSAHLMHLTFGRPAPVLEPETIIAFRDHLTLVQQSKVHVARGLLPGVANLANGHDDFVSTYPVQAYGELKDASGSEGICHSLMAERFALPGQVLAGTDSHTPHSGGLGCLAIGVGSTDMANSWVTGYIRCKVPETLRIEVDGALAPGVTAKDVVLQLLHMDTIRAGDAIGLVFEFGGSAVRAMSIDERATLTNMVAELGGFTGIVEPDETTVAYIKERRGVDFKLEQWMCSDEGSTYKDVIHIDANALSPMLARPGDPGNGVSVKDLGEEVRIDIAYGGSCTGGKREDFDAYHEVIAWALEHELPLPDSTKLYLQFGTMDVRDYCMEKGYLDTFAKAGVELIMPGCGACANCGPGSSTDASQVTISAINRNFPGRSGPGSVYLASPYTVAASAVAGHIASFDDLKGEVRQTSQ